MKLKYLTLTYCLPIVIKQSADVNAHQGFAQQRQYELK